MVWIALGCLGVPIWLLVGVLAALLWNRSHFKKQAGVFPAKLRLESGSFPGFNEKPASVYCVWVHDVLLVHKGLGLVSTLPVPVAAAEERKHLGDKTMYLRFRLDDGSILQMSGFGEDEALALGPFQTGKAPDGDQGE
jgi:hypothetical protein